MLPTIYRHLEPAELVAAARTGSVADLTAVWGAAILLVRLDDPSGTATRTLRTGVLDATAARVVSIPKGGTMVQRRSPSKRPQEAWPEALLAKQLKARLVRGPHIAVAIVKRDGTPLRGDDRFTIGRSAESNLLLATDGVSKAHAWVRPTDNGGYEVADSGSRNGTTLNGKPLAASRPVALAPGDVLDVAGVELILCPIAAVWTVVQGG